MERQWQTLERTALYGMRHAPRCPKSQWFNAMRTDNDATLRIASDAASAKRALHILRRLGHTRHLTDLGVIVAKKIARTFNVADAGMHYCTKDVLHAFDKKLRNG